jgi:hypothetical protein
MTTTGRHQSATTLAILPMLFITRLNSDMLPRIVYIQIGATTGASRF